MWVREQENLMKNYYRDDGILTLTSSINQLRGYQKQKHQKVHTQSGWFQNQSEQPCKILSYFQNNLMNLYFDQEQK